jgi:hypothetical protein
MCRIMRARALSRLLAANPRSARAFSDAAAKDPALAAALGASSSEANASGEKKIEAEPPVLEESAGGKKPFGWFKFGAFTALTGAAGAVGYYSYGSSLSPLDFFIIRLELCWLVVTDQDSCILEIIRSCSTYFCNC